MLGGGAGLVVARRLDLAPGHLLEALVGALEQVGVHRAGLQHAADQLLGEQHVPIHGLRRDGRHLRIS